MNLRHTEFFGPDFARGPHAPQRPETAALQIATAIAQLRAPLSRADEDLFAHGDFIRQLADRIAPDFASFVQIGLQPKVGSTITTSIRTNFGGFSLLEMWLADNVGGGLTSVQPLTVTFHTGVVLQTVDNLKRWLVITPSTGVVDVSVAYAAEKDWYWAVTRGGKVTYSSRLQFTF